MLLCVIRWDGMTVHYGSGRKLETDERVYYGCVLDIGGELYRVSGVECVKQQAYANFVGLSFGVEEGAAA